MKRILVYFLLAALLAGCAGIAGKKAQRETAKAKAHYDRGYAYFEDYDFDSAMAEFDEAIRINPDYAEAYHKRGVTYITKRAYNQAIADFDRAMEINPDYAEAYSDRGVAYFFKGDLDRAIADLNRAIEIKPDLADAYSNRGVAHYKKGSYDRAMADYNRILADSNMMMAITPDNASTYYYNRGLVYSGNRGFDSAIADFDRAIEMKPNHYNAYFHRGCAYYFKGGYDLAIADFETAQQIYPNHPKSAKLKQIVEMAEAKRDSVLAASGDDAKSKTGMRVHPSIRGLEEVDPFMYHTHDFNKAYVIDDSGNVFVDTKRKSGRYNVLETEDGTLAGSDRGEWGGELTFRDNTQRYTVMRENVRGIVNINNGIYVLTGLTHLSIDEGSVHKIEKIDGKWQRTSSASFRGCPKEFTVFNNRLYVIAYKGVLEVFDGEKVQVLLSDLFWRNHSLQSIYVNEKIIAIGMIGCLAIIDKKNYEVKAYAKPGIYNIEDGVFFDKDKTTLKRHPLNKQGAYTIPRGVKFIERNAFRGCTGLTSITIPGSVTKIGEDAFNGCTGLTSITIPGSVADIEWDAFRGCTGLTFVTIKGNTRIGQNAFYGCTGLTSVTCLNPTPPQASSGTFYGVKTYKTCLYVPKGSIDVYRAADGWNEFDCVKPLESAQEAEPAAAAPEPDIRWYADNPNAKRFTISTANELAGLARIVSGLYGERMLDDFSGKTVTLTQNIDLSAYNDWIPIGNYSVRGRDVYNLNAFSGTFDGGGYVISNLTINQPKMACQGLFGYIKSGKVENLGLENVSIGSGYNAGGVAGKIEKNSSVANCYSTGTVRGNYYVGGVVGKIEDSSSIANSYFAGMVNGNDGEHPKAGGVAGSVVSFSRVTNCYSTGTVSAGKGDVGGVVGVAVYFSRVTNCYSASAVSISRASRYVGGIAGSLDYISRVINCAALNPELKGTDEYVERIAGNGENLNRNAYTNNVAYASMTNTPYYAEWAGKGTDNCGGHDITVADIRADPTIGGRFTAKNGWTVEKGKLPGLRGKAVEMPVHFFIHVTVSPASARMRAGTARQFKAPAFGESGNKTVTWTVTGNTSAATTVSAAGLLTVAEDETADTLTVTAASKVNAAVSASATVTVGPPSNNTRWYTDAIATNPKATRFTISTAGDLTGLADIVSGVWDVKDDFSGKTIKLAGNIDLSAYDNWVPIDDFIHGDMTRESYPFAGTFDGCGHVISNLTINRPDANYQGLFGHIRRGRVINLGLENVNIKGGSRVGSVAGFVADRGGIANCHFTGNVSGVSTVGGLAGWVHKNSSVTGCHSAGTVSGESGVGGVVGLVGNLSTMALIGTNTYVANSYSTGIVSAEEGSVGGVAGVLRGNSGMINCYSTASVSGKMKYTALSGSPTARMGSCGDVGGLAGGMSDRSRIANSYFAGMIDSDACFGGGVVGHAGEVGGKNIVTNCAALNSEIKSTRGYDVGRVTGLVSVSENTLSNNAAYSEMKNGAGNTVWKNLGADKLDGINITAKEIRADGTIGGRFKKADGWTTENGKLPGLRGKAVELPGHLRD